MIYEVHLAQSGKRLSGKWWELLILTTKLLASFENMYNKTVCYVVIDEYKTDWFEFAVGVRQGWLCQHSLVD